jgi:hypothetical protein
MSQNPSPEWSNSSRNKKKETSKENLNSCMFCGQEEWSTYVCEECEKNWEANKREKKRESLYAEPKYFPSTNITIVVPEYGIDIVSQNLRDLTKKLQELGYDTSGGILGGEYGYGAYFENNIFTMHPYCWCEKETCEWCMGCSCPEEAHEYVVEKKSVSFNQWISAYEDGLSREIVTQPEHQCDYCKGVVGGAPNFLHKPSNSKIWWYKYIGREMEIELFDSWETIYEECEKSL